MLEEELLGLISRLEDAYGTGPLKKGTVELWIKYFCNIDRTTFDRAIEQVIRTKDFFPRIASMFKALTEVGWRKKGGWKVVRPYIIYKDQAGYTYALANNGGECPHPPETIEKDDGRILRRIF